MTPELVSLLNSYSVPAGICDDLGNWIALNNKLQTLLAGNRHNSLADYMTNDTEWRHARAVISRNRQIRLADTAFTGPLQGKLARATRIDFLDTADASYLIEFFAHSEPPIAPARQLQKRSPSSHNSAAAVRNQEPALRDRSADPVTGLPGYTAFTRQLNHQWKLALCQRTALSLLLLETRSGDDSEDAVERAQRDTAMQSLARCLGKSAGRWSDFVARTGENEFAMVLPGTDRAGIIALARRLAHAIDQLPVSDPRHSDWMRVRIGGHSCRPAPQISVAALLQRSTEALERAADTEEHFAVTSTEPLPQGEDINA